MRIRSFSTLMLVLVTFLASCAIDGSTEPIEDQAEASPETEEDLASAELDAAGISAPGTDPSCPNKRFTLSLTDTEAHQEVGSSNSPGATYSCPMDIYLHPSNARGGWIEA